MVNHPDVFGFFGEFRYLSNFHVCDFVWDGMIWTSSEHAYQASKLNDFSKMKRFAKLSTPKDAKIAGGLISLPDNWNDVKRQLMHSVVLAKFEQNPDIAKLLVGTGNAYLEETNTWHDTTWGVCNGVGSNWLGEILMDVRSKLNRDILIDFIIGD